jgi:hypothetical protein
MKNFRKIISRNQTSADEGTSPVLNPTDTDQLILGGVLAVQETKTGSRVVKSITTWQTNRNYNRVEVSCGTALDFTCRNVRDAVDVLRGAKGDSRVLGRAVTIADTVLRGLAKPEPEGPGVLAGDANSPAYRNITAKLEGDVVAVSFECSPVISVSAMMLFRKNLRQAGFMPQNGDDMLKGLIFDFCVYSKDTGQLLVKYIGLSYDSGDLDLSAHRIVIASGQFKALDRVGTDI